MINDLLSSGIAPSPGGVQGLTGLWNHRNRVDTENQFQDGTTAIANEIEGLEPQNRFAPGSENWFRSGSGVVPLENQQMLFARPRAALIDEPAASFMVDGLFLENSIISFVGASNTYKSFAALDLALSIATGQPTWCGRAIRKHGPVLYIIGEGKGRFKYRLQAWEQVHKVEADGFFWTNGPCRLTNDGEADDTNHLIRDCNIIKPSLIVVDTLARNFGSHDENSTQHMSEFIRNLDRIRYATQAAILVVHHTAKGGTAERGNSAFRGAIETMVMFAAQKEPAGFVTLSCTKQREADYFDDITLKANSVKVKGEFEESGEPVTSVVLESMNPDEAAQTAAQQEAVRREELQRALNAMKKAPMASSNEIAKALGGNRQKTLALIREAKQTV